MQICRQKLRTSGGLFDLDALNERIAENEQRMAEPDFWNDSEKAQKLINDNNQLKERRDTFTHLRDQLDELATSVELLKEMPDDDLDQGQQTLRIRSLVIPQSTHKRPLLALSGETLPCLSSNST